MTRPPTPREPHHAPWRRPAVQRAYHTTAVLFVAGVAVQVYLAGLAVTVDATHWRLHAGFAHVLELLPPLLLVLGVAGGGPRRFAWMGATLTVLFVLQYVFIHGPIDLMRPLHPTNALALFAVAAVAAAQSRPRPVGARSRKR